MDAATVARAARTSPRPAVVADPLYGAIRLSWWAAALVATPPFRRLAGISLSDVPGEWLFQRPFPSRLEHSLGVYHLVRLARPRDRALQAAALAHDLGHGPFSHLSESLMRERLGLRHESRSAALLEDVRNALPRSVARQLAWLDWDEVAAFVQGEGERGALLAGRLDFDNAEYVARFLSAGGIRQPRYDPVALARALRPLPAEISAWSSVRQPARTATVPRRAPFTTVYLVADAQGEAEAWQADRAAMYSFLHEGHQNIAVHAMLRKALDLATSANLLPDSFFDLSDESAYQLLASSRSAGASALAQAARSGPVYQCVWEAEASPRHERLRELVSHRREHLALEERLAAEAGLAAHGVIVEAVVSAAHRALPPLAPRGHPEHLVWLPEPMPAPQRLHVLVASKAGRDYRRRLRLAAERYFGPLGISERRELPASGEDATRRE
jgi:HD superfamily phosphohydrolase